MMFFLCSFRIQYLFLFLFQKEKSIFGSKASLSKSTNSKGSKDSLSKSTNLKGSKDSLSKSTNSKDNGFVKSQQLTVVAENIDEKIRNEINLAKSELNKPENDSKVNEGVQTALYENIENLREQINKCFVNDDSTTSEKLCPQCDLKNNINLTTTDKNQSEDCETNVETQEQEVVTKSANDSENIINDTTFVCEDSENVSQEKTVQNDITTTSI